MYPNLTTCATVGADSRWQQHPLLVMSITMLVAAKPLRSAQYMCMAQPLLQYRHVWQLVDASCICQVGAALVPVTVPPRNIISYEPIDCLRLWPVQRILC